MVGAGLMLVVVGALGGCAVLGLGGSGDQDGDGAAAGAAPTSTTAAGPALRAAVPSDDPLATAQQWLQATVAVSAADPGPAAWLDRVEPVVTGPLAQQLREVPGAGPAGAGWEEFVARGCSTAVVDVGGTIPPEAPRSPTSVYVQVAGQQVTTCRGEDPADPVTEPVAATVELRLDDGVWRVAQQLA